MQISVTDRQTRKMVEIYQHVKKNLFQFLPNQFEKRKKNLQSYILQQISDLIGFFKNVLVVNFQLYEINNDCCLNNIRNNFQ